MTWPTTIKAVTAAGLLRFQTDTVAVATSAAYSCRDSLSDMFVLLAVKDTVPVEANNFKTPTEDDLVPREEAVPGEEVVANKYSISDLQAIQDSLNKKYANKLISGKGLALSVYDILTAENGKATWGNGLMYYKVSFRLLLFAPYVGEVLVGRVLNTTRDYIRASLGFFEDIYILPGHLPPNSAYDAVDKLYFWYAGADEDKIMNVNELMNTIKNERLYIDPQEPIRFRVDRIEWQAVKPTPNIPLSQMQDGDAEAEQKDPIEKAGYKIFVTIAESGLGVTSWWEDAGDEMELEQEQE